MTSSLVTDTLLVNAVPQSVREDAFVALRLLPPAALPTLASLIQDTNSGKAHYRGLYVDGEVVQVFNRMYYPWHEGMNLGSKDSPSREIVAAWMSRNANGRVRQKALRILLQSDSHWTVPFVIQLCGEYVPEIAQDVLDFITKTLIHKPELLAAYLRFANDNPAFMALSAQRATSYWAAYGRTRYGKQHYPQTMALRALEQLRKRDAS